MARAPHVSVIIVNYNGGEYLKGALQSLAAQTMRRFEVLLVDNASTDGSMEAVSGEGLPALTVLQQRDNLGFAAANNLAARKAQGEWLALLNPDAEAAPDWLAVLMEAASRYPAVTSFASAQIDLHHPHLLDGAGDAYLGFGIPWRGGFGRPIEERPPEGECFSPCGAGAFIKRETFHAHGGFDERFFCYCEDVDLGYRMRLAGEACLFLPDAVIYHAGSAISGQASPFSLFHGTRNRLWTYVKNTPLRLLILTLPVHIALTIAILLRGLMTGRFWYTLRGLGAALKGIGPILKARKSLKKTRKARLSDLSAAMCWNPITMLQRKPHIRPIKPEQNP
ncbi:MAG: glycosyltransferase family 2 protein [Pseudomonadota bacterium]